MPAPVPDPTFAASGVLQNRVAQDVAVRHEPRSQMDRHMRTNCSQLPEELARAIGGSTQQLTSSKRARKTPLSLTFNVNEITSISGHDTCFCDTASQFQHRLVPVGGHSVAVITRFDRAGQSRIPFISAATLLGLPHGDPGAYTMLADGIRQFGDNVPGELRELWRRLVFSLLASNYDDHLRNHGFLMHAPGRWTLSPAYDINPVPEMDRVRMSKTAITEDQEEPTIASALAAAPRFGLKASEAKQILGVIFTAVSGWHKTGRQLRLKASTLDTYASAFDHLLMKETKALIADRAKWP